MEPKIALLNLDNFKDINESYRLEVGDAILIQFADRLSKLESTNVKAYRLSGDIFALLACGNITLKSLQSLSRDFARSLEKNNFIVDDINLSISVTIGLAAGQYKLLSHAEIAHLNAKKNNKGYAIFDEELPAYKEMIENIQITKEIRSAISHNNILLFGQKIINNQSQEEKYEALMRIRSEDGRIISPFFFLEQAKKAKLYPELSRSIIKQACHYFKDRESAFSINLMIEDIKNEKTIAFLFDTLKKTNTAKRVILEIVESEAIETFKEVEDFIQDAKALGCKVAIDDFGTGYSNFEYITRLNIDILKIDGSLIKNIHIDKNTHLAVKTIVNFAQVLNLEVVAEFVHCEEVQQIVKDLGVTYSQGYLFHQPEQLG
ncbi:GGDEF domain-containing phosphodiesterase [Oceanospirillum multiglobuliferum]|uniref:EAL domain-containing protein n=1 Tax=Oceanospirillum multiglobuliferum TaxID=64969 RepID=UPI002E126015